MNGSQQIRCNFSSELSDDGVIAAAVTRAGSPAASPRVTARRGRRKLGRVTLGVHTSPASLHTHPTPSHHQVSSSVHCTPTLPSEDPWYPANRNGQGRVRRMSNYQSWTIHIYLKSEYRLLSNISLKSLNGMTKILCLYFCCILSSGPVWLNLWRVGQRQSGLIVVGRLLLRCGPR